VNVPARRIPVCDYLPLPPKRSHAKRIPDSDEMIDGGCGQAHSYVEIELLLGRGFVGRAEVQ